MNIFDAAIAPEGNGHVASAASVPNGQPAFRLTAPVGRRGNGRRVHLGIRPHLIEVGANGSADATGKVISNQWLGDQSPSGVEVGGCSLVGVADGRSTPRPAMRCRCVSRSAPCICSTPRRGRALVHGLAPAG